MPKNKPSVAILYNPKLDTANVRESITITIASEVHTILTGELLETVPEKLMVDMTEKQKKDSFRRLILKISG